MRIKSSFKDYYDFIAHIYGGGDERITYIRDRILPLRDMGSAKFEDSIHINIRKFPDLPYGIIGYDSKTLNGDTIDFKWLVVCGKLYLLVGYYKSCEEPLYHIVNEKIDTMFVNALSKLSKYRANFLRKVRTTVKEYIGFTEKSLIDISRQIGQPVFIINKCGWDSINIESRIPNLSELGFPSIMKPEQLYQEIAYYISNVMVESPDVKPPVEISNSDKIVQHGFDLKKSFRHRKD